MACIGLSAHRARMPSYPSFYLLGAIAGFVLWRLDAPPPFPFLGLVALACGGLGLLLSIAYVRAFEPWQWRVKLAALRRAWRAIAHVFIARPMTASALRASRARS